MKTYVMNKIAEGLKFVSLESQSSQSSSTPDYTNKGFKCLEITIKSETKTSRRIATNQTNNTTDKVQKSFISVRISNKVIQCLSKDTKTCNKYDKKESCIQDFKSSNSPDKIISLESGLADQVAKFYFNRWICPVESGLKSK
jgi:ribosomal protein L28